MYGLSIRWSLSGADADVADRLRDYVKDISLARFTGLPGLHMKTWRMIEGDWFEGTYVFDSPHSRDHFLAEFMPTEDSVPGSLIIGSAPVAYEPFEVVAVAEGQAGFVTGMGRAPE